MNHEQQRIAIAKACGYTLSGGLEWWTNNDGVHDEPPDYLNDLNAMHEAEKVFLKMETLCFWETYSNRLTTSLGCLDIFHATATQRAEAFLRTIGKWEDDK